MTGNVEKKGELTGLGKKENICMRYLEDLTLLLLACLYFFMHMGFEHFYAFESKVVTVNNYRVAIRITKTIHHSRYV